jgi:nucleoside phosphorylase
VSCILVVTAVRLETRAVLAALTAPRRRRPATPPSWEGEAGTNRVTLVEGGVGPGAARRALLACPAPCDVVVSIGFAGALTPGLAPGDLVLPGTVLWEEEGALRRYTIPPGLLRAAADALPTSLAPTAARGNLLSSPVVLAAVAAKLTAARRYDALAVEMEAAALAAEAAARGAALLVLRAILDPLDLSIEGLPRNLEASWAARMRLAAMPGTWPLLMTLRRHAGAAKATLAMAARAVLPALRGEG